jgi:hypothetical protein
MEPSTVVPTRRNRAVVHTSGIGRPPERHLATKLAARSDRTASSPPDDGQQHGRTRSGLAS